MATQLKPLTWQQAAWRRIESKRLISVVLLAVLLLAVWGLGRAGVLDPARAGAYRHAHPLVAILVFIFLFAVSILGALPSLPLNLAAGFLWGGVAGGLYSTIGATAGGWVAFQAARHLFGQPFASRYGDGWAGRVATEFARHGWKFVAFARINPIMPTGPLNYLLGLTALSNRAFIGATLRRWIV